MKVINKFIFLLITVSFVINNIACNNITTLRVGNHEMKNSDETIILKSIYQLAPKADLIILGEILRIEKDKDNKNYALVLIREIYKGRSIPVISIAISQNLKQNILNLNIQKRPRGIFYLVTETKNIYYYIENAEDNFLYLEDSSISYKNMFCSSKRYINKLKKIVASQPKSPIELYQDKAIEIAKDRAQTLGYRVEHMLIDIDENNSTWNSYIYNNQFWKDSLEMKNKFDGRDYWAIYFSPNRLDVLDGDLWIFVDKKTYEIIFTIPKQG